MADDTRLDAVLPYAVMVNDDPAAERNNWRGEVKVRIRVPLDMAVPCEILGVVLTPEVSRCDREQDRLEVAGWVDTMIYYRPYQYDGQEEERVMRLGPEDAYASPPKKDDTVFDDFFLDLEDEDKGLMEVEGVRKYTVAEDDEASCLSSRVNFSMQLDHPETEEEPKFSPQVHSVECLIRGSRMIDLAIVIDLLSPEGDFDQRGESDEVILEGAQTEEKLYEATLEADFPEETEVIEDRETMESWDEPMEMLMAGDSIEAVEVIDEFEYPVLGLGYSSQSSPRRPSRSRRLEGSVEGGIIRPRQLARSSTTDTTTVTEVSLMSEENKTKPSGRRQTTMLRFHFDN